MGFESIMQKSVESALWQDYRAAETGMIVLYLSDPVSELPIREVPDDVDSSVVPEPHYETRTWGFYGCAGNKIRAAFVKGKMRYVFFMTKYAGSVVQKRDTLLITGFYHVAQTADVKKMHVIFSKENGCIDKSCCMALRADEACFVALDDAVEVTGELLKEWGQSSRITRQTKILLTVEQTKALLDKLRSRENNLDRYVAETARLAPDGEDEESEVSTQAAPAAEVAPESPLEKAPAGDVPGSDDEGEEETVEEAEPVAVPLPSLADELSSAASKYDEEDIFGTEG